MKVTSFQDVPHSSKRMAFQTHAVRLYIQTHGVRLYIRAFVEVRRIVFHSASKKELTAKNHKIDLLMNVTL
jgi:hypothetical protein